MPARFLTLIAVGLLIVALSPPVVGLVATGRVVAWGGQYEGGASPPLDDDFVAVAAGGCFGLGLRSDGSLAAWGLDFHGAASPPAGNDFVAIDAGEYYGLALRSDGSIAGWGVDTSGQLPPPAGNDYVAVSAGYRFGLALREDGSIVGWGQNTHGQATPPEGNDYKAISAGDMHSLAVREDGSLVAWGNDWADQVSGTPAGNDFVAVSAGERVSLALREDGSIAAWGAYGSASFTPPAGNDFKAISAGYDHGLALRDDGSMVAWGDAWHGEVPAPAGYGALAIDAGPNLDLAVAPWPPGGFGKAAPGDHTGGQSEGVTLQWVAAQGAASYEYCVDTSDDDTCLAWVDAGTTMSAGLSGLALGTYFWQVRAHGSFGTTYADDGQWWDFTVGPPGAFGKEAPSDGATGRGDTVVLSWEATPGAASYRYCVDTSDDDACDGSWVGVGSATSAEVTGLADATTYFWQARARNDQGVTDADGGVWWSFTTGPPESFGKASPPDGAMGQSTRPTLSWEAVPTADSYEYCVDTSDDDACGSWVSTGTATTAGLSGLAYETTYFWQARAVNAFGTTDADGGAWWSFDVKPTPTVEEMSLRSFGAYDGWVLEREEELGKGGMHDSLGPTACVGDDDADRQYRAVLDFNTTALPDDAVVTGVVMRIRREGLTGTNPVTTHGVLEVDIKTGYFHQYPLEFFDFHAVGSRGRVGRFYRADPDGWYRGVLRAPGYPLVNLTGHTQFRLRFDLDDDDDGVADCLSFFTGDAAVAADRPELIISYYLP